ncbi:MULTISPECIES: hypothetical protein [Streptomyces]|uniref:Secreted protein n=1 Tax=Streptomyces eurythermus TaxID=42237 RepID=A0ABW6YQ44_9ACTN|nr:MULTISPECIES: hypothetical protein [Streptomyces]QIS74489.1 hypothetical protein HB370_34630 [Streptomyces sp. DSM 40868]WDM10510.1 hypothetical protein J3S85_02480 [Streptomyces lavenduligriseus]
MLAGGAVLAAARTASAAVTDWDCDEQVDPVDDSEPGPGRPVTIEGDRCTPQRGNPDELIHVISVHYGQDGICRRVEQRGEPGHIVGYCGTEAETGHERVTRDL